MINSSAHRWSGSEPYFWVGPHHADFVAYMVSEGVFIIIAIAFVLFIIRRDSR